MDPLGFAGGLIGTAANLWAGDQNRAAQRDFNQKQAEQTAANMKMQEEFAKSGIQWKVNDARAAGIHPLYALGANTVSYSPVSLGGAPETPGAGLAAAGQDLSRAIHATRPSDARVEAVEATRLQLEGLQLDNDIKRATIASSLQRLKQSANPPLPIPDSLDPFKVPEKNKSEERPPLMLFGQRISTPSGTSPMKAWEDQLGDDGPISWLMQTLVGSHMLYDNFNKRYTGSTTDRVLSAVDNALSSRNFWFGSPKAAPRGKIRW